MTRIQVYLEPELREELETLASRRKMSRSELIRQSIRRFLQEEKVSEEEPLLGIIGLGRSGIDDVSEKHDKYLTEEAVFAKLWDNKVDEVWNETHRRDAENAEYHRKKEEET